MWSLIVKKVYPDEIDEPNLTWLIQEFLHTQKYPQWIHVISPTSLPSMKKLLFTHPLLPVSLLPVIYVELVVWSVSTFMQSIDGKIPQVTLTHCLSTLPQMTQMTIHPHVGSRALRLFAHTLSFHSPWTGWSIHAHWYIEWQICHWHVCCRARLPS